MLRKAKNCNIINKFHSLWLMWGGNSPLNYLSINFIISKLFHYVWNKWTHEGCIKYFSFLSILFWIEAFNLKNKTTVRISKIALFSDFTPMWTTRASFRRKHKAGSWVTHARIFFLKKPSRIRSNQKKNQR